jgi:hypothetical protein
MAPVTEKARPPPWLAAYPELGSLYLCWSNRRRRVRVLRFSGAFILAAAILLCGLLWARLGLVAARLDELSHHVVLIVTLAVIASAAVVFRRRVAYAAQAEKSWLAALPVRTRARRFESLTLICAPVIILPLAVCAAGVLAIPFGGLVALTWLLAGTVGGALMGLIIPAAKPVIPYPGSRYVPHRAVRNYRPTPSLAALGIWPIRRMFAMLQPKTLARTVFPLLIAMPMGTVAADALVLIGSLMAMTGLTFLATSIVWVFRRSRRWLQPLPLASGRLARVVAARGFLAMIALGGVAAWLVRVAHQ